MKLVTLGLSKENAVSLELLEKVSFTPEILHDGLEKMQQACGLFEVVILSTCQRTEIYAVLSADQAADIENEVAAFLGEFHGCDAAEIKSALRHYDVDDSARHLFNVSSGLNAIALGENQILGQVREAYGVALGAGTTGKVTSKLFQAALSAGKRVRTETEIGQNPISISSLAVDLAQEALHGLEEKTALIIGSGEMSELAAKLLKKRGIGTLSLINRTLGRAQELAKTLGGHALPWEGLDDALADIDVVISSTAAPHHILYSDAVSEVMKSRSKPLFLVDIAMPRDIEPEIAEIPNVHLYNLNDLQGLVDKNRATREREVPRAGKIIESEVALFMNWYDALGTVPTLRALRDHAEDVRLKELEHAFQRLEELTEEERAIIERLSRRIVTKLLHHPTVQLKENGSAEKSLEEAARKLFGLHKRA